MADTNQEGQRNKPTTLSDFEGMVEIVTYFIFRAKVLLVRFTRRLTNKSKKYLL